MRQYKVKLRLDNAYHEFFMIAANWHVVFLKVLEDFDQPRGLVIRPVQ